MKKLLVCLALIAILMPTSIRTQVRVISDSAKAAVEARIKLVNETNARKGYRWRAGITSLSYLTDEERTGLDGLRLNLSSAEIRDRIKKGQTDYEKFKASRNAGLRKSTTEINWLNWMGKIRNQGSSSLCFVYAATGATEALLHQSLSSVPGDSGIDLSISYVTDNLEQNCATGWGWEGNFTCALEAIQSHKAVAVQGWN